MLPIPDGTIGMADRYQAALHYRLLPRWFPREEEVETWTERVKQTDTWIERPKQTEVWN